MTMTPNDATHRLHDAAARLGYEVTRKDLAKYYPGAKKLSVRKLDDVRREAREASLDPTIPAKTSREIYSVAYDAGSRAAVADLERGR
jgi:hypothetical protein